MAGRNYHKNQMKRRKAKQAEECYIAALRREVVNYEGTTERGAARMSKEAMEGVIRRGKKRQGITGAPIGFPLAMAAAALLGSRR
jgi:uncharacterized protein (TIGR03382 family)